MKQCSVSSSWTDLPHPPVPEDAVKIAKRSRPPNSFNFAAKNEHCDLPLLISHARLTTLSKQRGIPENGTHKLSHLT